MHTFIPGVSLKIRIFVKSTNSYNMELNFITMIKTFKDTCFSKLFNQLILSVKNKEGTKTEFFT